MWRARRTRRIFLVRDGLLFALAQRYREDPSHFLSLSKQTINSVLTREILAQLVYRPRRNLGRYFCSL